MCSRRKWRVEGGGFKEVKGVEELVEAHWASLGSSREELRKESSKSEERGVSVKCLYECL